MAVSSFDWRSVLLARHAQHVVLIHFPIALFIAGVFFDVVSFARKQYQLGQVALYNFAFAAATSIPTIATGLIAWQWALEGQRLKGTLLLHLICALAATILIWIVLFLAWRGHSNNASFVKYLLEFLAVGLLGLTGHLGGFLSGVNGGP